MSTMNETGVGPWQRYDSGDWYRLGPHGFVNMYGYDKVVNITRTEFNVFAPDGNVSTSGRIIADPVPNALSEENTTWLRSEIDSLLVAAGWAISGVNE